jgi:hypothetical protein
LDSYLPFAKTTIHQTCTLVAAARIKSKDIYVATNEVSTFSEKYGNTAQLKITFPAGVTEEKLSLKIQVYIFFFCGCFVMSLELTLVRLYFQLKPEICMQKV